MALTRHQKLARKIKAQFADLQFHHDKTAVFCGVLRFFFYEPYFIDNRPPMSERALESMMQSHRLGLIRFSLHQELWEAARSTPLNAYILPMKVYLGGYRLAEGQRHWIPWRVHIDLPSKGLRDLQEAMLVAISYCAAEEEMSEWIDWHEEEDKANTFTNKLLAKIYQKQEKLPEENLKKQAFPAFQEAALEYYKKIHYPKIFKTLIKTGFAPTQNTTVERAYTLVLQSLRDRNRRDLENFQQFWRDKLEGLIFSNLDWTEEQKKLSLKERFSVAEPQLEPKMSLRWQTSLALDRYTYASFIRYFADIFIQNPLKNKVEGEIALLLWIMVYVSQEPDNILSIKRLLELTTANVREKMLLIDDHEYEISRGLTELLFEYTGGIKTERQQKLFPNLTPDKLEDYFHRASQILLPAGSLAALPEAFLIFPHVHKNQRIPPKLRQNWQKHPPKIYSDTISRHELKRQLIAKATLKKA